jgi:hypothetical protein
MRCTIAKHFIFSKRLLGENNTLHPRPAASPLQREGQHKFVPNVRCTCRVDAAVLPKCA